MTISETPLPGVGKKFEVELDDGEMVIVIHNTGKREIFRREDPDSDAEKLFTFDEQLARTVGSIVEGAHFQPTDTDRQETTLPGGLLLEWYELDSESPLVDTSIATAHIGRRTGVTIIAIQRGEETITSPGPETVLKADDTLIVVGTAENFQQFKEQLAEQ